MKRNIVPLLGIAVVAAILSTGVFYGLFAGKLRSASADVPGQPIVIAAHDMERGAVLHAGDLKVSRIKETLAGSFSNPDQLNGATLVAAVKQNEPLLDERVISKTPQPGSRNSSVPSGLRAVSIRISESDGLVGMLRPGTKVDLQAVQDRNGGLELRTILQDVEVVAVNPQTQPAGGNRGPVSIVTVLARPEDSDLLALADSGSRLRLALRNPLDEQTAPRRALSLGAVFQANTADTGRSASAAGAPSARSLQLELQVLRVNAAAAGQLESKLAHAPAGASLAVTNFTSGSDSRGLIQKLAGQHDVEILSERNLSASAGHSARFRTGSAASQLGLELLPESGPDGKVNLRVRQEIVSQSKAGMETRRYETGIPLTGTFLVTGILGEPRDREMLERLFPGHAWADGRLLIVVTSKEDGQLSTARSERSR
jgi:pilus assembly protein CpaB